MKTPTFSWNAKIIWIMLSAIFSVCVFWYARMSTSTITCLTNDERAAYEVVDKSRPGKVAVTVFDVEDGSTRRVIEASIVNPTHYRPVEIHHCHFYLAQPFNYDQINGRALPGYHSDIVRVDYKGHTQSIVVIDRERKEEENFGRLFANDFRVSSDERFIALEQDFAGEARHALVIKNANTGDDAFSLPMSTIAQDHPSRAGVIDLIGWTKDSRFFWAGTSETAYVKSYIRVDTHDWSYEIFDAPEGAMGGSPLNLEKGLVPINPGGQWTGSAEMDEILTQRLRTEGFVNKLYLYNLFTKKQFLITETKEEPMFWFEPNWLSDTELEYTMPDGTKKTHRVQ